MIRFNSGMRSIRILMSMMPYNAMKRLIFAIAGLSSVVTAIVAPCCFIRQVTSLVLRVGRYRRSGGFDAAGRSVSVLHIHECEPVPCRQRRRGCVDGVVMPVAVICRDERVVIPCRYRPRRFLDRYAFARWTASVVLGEEIYLRDAEPILSCDGRARLVDARSVILSRATHRVPFHQERLFASGYELYQARINSFQRRIDERFLRPKILLPSSVKSSTSRTGFQRCI